MQFALLIHGPFSENWLEKIESQITKFKKGFEQIVIVTYSTDIDKCRHKVEELRLKNVEIVSVKDLINPGFFNINRQLLCVKTGLECISDDKFVLKLRIDQSVDFNKVIKYASADKIITTNCYSRVDRPYHPSDMFIAAKSSLLKEYYSLPYDEKTHLMTELENVKLCSENSELTYVPLAPESMLCRNFLQNRGWKLENTKKDSLKALQKYFIILNSWNIDFRSKKIRSTKLWKSTLIIPHYFSALPFTKGPVEKASCYMQHDIMKTLPTLKDIIFLLISKMIWFCWKYNLSNPINRFKLNDRTENRKRKREFLKLLPYFLVHKKIRRLDEKIKAEG